MLRDFKDFILRGSVLDLAVAVILGVAFNAVVQSFANDVLLPTIFALLGGEPDLSNVVFTVRAQPIVVGTFLGALLNLLLVGFALFLLVRTIARFQKPAPAQEEPAEPDEVVLLREIRDTLRAS